MDFEKLTIKSGEAVAGAQELARRAGNPELTPDHLTLALLDQELPRTLVERSGASAGDASRRGGARLAQQPSVSGGSGQPQASAAFSRVLDKRSRRGAERSATSSSRSSTCCSRSSSSRATRCSRALKEVRGGQRVTSQDPRAPTRRSRSTVAT